MVKEGGCFEQTKKRRLLYEDCVDGPGLSRFAEEFYFAFTDCIFLPNDILEHRDGVLGDGRLSSSISC